MKKIILTGSKELDFQTALHLMKNAGMVKRMAWTDQNIHIKIKLDEAGKQTIVKENEEQKYNDSLVDFITTEDILAKDWVQVVES